MWEKCCDKPNKYFDFGGIYKSVSVIVGNEVVDIREGYNKAELVLDDSCRECIWGEYVSCTFIGGKRGKVLDVAVSRRGVVVIHTNGVIRIYVERPRQTYLKCGDEKFYEWKA